MARIYKALAVCLIVVIALLDSIDAQDQTRDGRRRTGRRNKSTTTPVPSSLDESEELSTAVQPRKQTGQTTAKVQRNTSGTPTPLMDTHKTVGKSTTLISKEPGEGTAHNASAPPPLASRNNRRTRKPRPSASSSVGLHNSTDTKAKPTLPTFVRKTSGRTGRKNTFSDSTNGKSDGLSSSTVSIPESTTKQKRGNQRRRTTTTVTAKTVFDSPSIVTEAPSTRGKKRFGNPGRRQTNKSPRRNNSTATKVTATPIPLNKRTSRRR